MLNQFTLTILLLFVLLGCATTDNTPPAAKQGQPEKANRSSQVKADTILAAKPVASAKAKQLAGLYFARLPCPNCGRVRINLSLEANQTYDKTEEYLQSNEIFFETGNWVMNNAQLTLIPTEADAIGTQSTIRYFHFENGTLRLVKQNGKPYPGKTSDYLFKKK